MARPDRRVEHDGADLVGSNDVGQQALLSEDDEVRLGQQIEAARLAHRLGKRGATISAKRRKLRRTVRR
jgi:hypothetical protein